MKLKEHNIKIKSRTIITSRGVPTVEVDVVQDTNIFRSSCPSGMSTGINEARIMLDHRKRYNGKDVSDAHLIIKDMVTTRLLEYDVDPKKICEIDKKLLELDGSKNKEMMGANVILPLSLSFCRLAAYLSKKDLYRYISSVSGYEPAMPIPHFNVLNGGMHSGNDLCIQEFMVAFDHTDIRDNMESACVFYESLRSCIKDTYGPIYTSVGDEGGFSPPIKTIEEALDLLIEAGQKCGKSNFKVAIDAAANSFYKNSQYEMEGKRLNRQELCDRYIEVFDKYPQIYSIEDPFSEVDIEGWSLLHSRCKSGFNIVGDDITVTNVEFIKEYGEKKICNVLLVKPNQIGSFTETINAIKMARNYGMKIMVSHRSGETEDSFISDLAVGVGAEYFKAGAPCRGERVSKYNQLLRLAEEMKK